VAPPKDRLAATAPPAHVGFHLGQTAPIARRMPDVTGVGPSRAARPIRNAGSRLVLECGTNIPGEPIGGGRPCANAELTSGTLIVSETTSSIAVPRPQPCAAAVLSLDIKLEVL
jgi:hypothetical protein